MKQSNVHIYLYKICLNIQFAVLSRKLNFVCFACLGYTGYITILLCSDCGWNFEKVRLWLCCKIFIVWLKFKSSKSDKAIMSSTNGPVKELDVKHLDATGKFISDVRNG